MHQLIDQNIENIENFHVKALNGRRPSLENWLKSVISLISLKYALNGMAFDWKNWYFSPKLSVLISSKKSLENRQFSVKKLQTV